MDKMELAEFFKNFLEDNKNSQSYRRKEYKDLHTDISAFIIADVHTGGARGGNCWNDDPACPYREDRDDIIDEIKGNVLSAVKYTCEELGIPKSEYEFVVANLAHNQMDAEISERTEYEYYGNYTEYKLYGIHVSQIFEPLLNDEQKEVFNRVLDDFTNGTTKVFQNEKLSKSASELETRIKNFDATKAKEKKVMLDQIKALEKRLEDFDAKAYKEKKALKSQLESVQSEIEKLNAPEPAVKTKTKKIKK